jgi:hypothetical protein
MSETVMCPKCGGNTWDNRATKKNPKAPDYKCRDRSCDGVVWPPKNGAAPRAAASSARQPISMGPTLPYEDEIDAEIAAFAGPPTPARADVSASFALYDRCFEHAFKVASAAKITDQQAIASMAACLFIQANRR